MSFIEAIDLVKTYSPKGSPQVRALDGLNLEVQQGSVTALLGPNGAGKTTTVKVLTTLIQPDSGSAFIDGVNVVAEPQAIRRMIGASGQYAAVDQNLTGFENLLMVGKLYHLGTRVARQRATELIELFDLVEAQNRTVKGYSGGMRRRIDLAGALVIRPPVLFLDEPTTGLDPRSRLGLWEVIERLVADGTTVLLTTQYLEEADRLANSISVIDNGQVIAQGTADELKASIGGLRVAVTLVDESQSENARTLLTRFGSGEQAILTGRTLVVPVQDGPHALAAIVSAAAEEGIGLHDAGMRRPTLDDVFLQLTGRSAQTDEAETESAA
ncbi:daunorubicin resistance protein DrrA family ABC transporter ATP-binding protein [Alpinimonas psychrophila]|uniref:ABC-2 type transport system ATP-binding protein n=1 Tax=Alpinimonas psychrophila TaxID=748908 RepID=A0A7W3PPH9_9MICO|nr:ATP-binding cassette domain-containing protein [Alpinimonas psychrophila]MBA8829485.1 ABC-2 type transport system ATP-binding protein [Alpinimonas psychrophila]